LVFVLFLSLGHQKIVSECGCGGWEYSFLFLNVGSTVGYFHVETPVHESIVSMIMAMESRGQICMCERLMRKTNDSVTPMQ
jgi:hypothetical protein